MHECMLCKKDMKRSKNQFGSSCINNVYTFLDINEKVRRKDMENILYKNIMHRTNMTGLNNNQRIWLADRYLTQQYLNRLNYGNFEEIKSEIDNEIKRMNNVKKLSEIQTAKKITLKSAYDLYKREQKFQTSINTIKNMSGSDEEKLKLLTTCFSYIFNLYRHKSQYERNSLRAMQFAFWQLVIEIGGRYFGYDISAKFLNHSLEENPSDILITAGPIITEIITDVNFDNKMNEIIKKYGKDGSFNLEMGKETITFSDSDLYFSIHHANIIMSAFKNNNDTWNLDITFSDTYDYSKFKEIKDYLFDTESVQKSLFSSTLYNLAYYSMKLGVMKEYEVTIKLQIDNYEVK